MLNYELIWVYLPRGVLFLDETLLFIEHEY